MVGVPIAAPQTCAQLAEGVDEIVCAHTVEPFMAVGLWYRDFTATTDEEVSRLLEEAQTPAAAGR